ncbi:uncharacterized protein TNCV_2788301 [Trichonephila clavipes]|uniref:Transposase Tc1-like domain-containing protein n=1 Tax=Trichonephila clavipes TaxID=2585209 RepID=A0A8X6SS84_TRICX|nr:uncharacterized protein TNCV_2788301 [Trichonephila clavipes]
MDIMLGAFSKRYPGTNDMKEIFEVACLDLKKAKESVDYYFVEKDKLEVSYTEEESSQIVVSRTKHRCHGSRIPSTIQSPSCHLAECKTPLSPCPSSKTCLDMGLRTVLTVQKPKKATPISKIVHQRFLAWSREHAMCVWTSSHWACVKFFDESKFSLKSDLHIENFVHRTPGIRHLHGNIIGIHGYTVV